MAVTEVARTIRHVKRYTEILEVLAKHGFAEAVTTIGLDRLIERGARVIGASTPVNHLSRQVRMRLAMEQLGPTFMKLGQMLSCRKDLIPADWANEFAKLQAQGPRLPFDVIKGVLAKEFDGREAELFASIEETPIAAASMAQVHRATLADGTPIVLKIMRPGTEDLAQADLDILRTLAEFAEAHLKNTGFSPTGVVREFTRELKREIDFTFEGRNTDKLREAFDDEPGVCIPAVYWEATTRRVLALEELRGILLANLKEGELTQEQRTAVVSHGADAVAKQCLEIGLFHADPHPGNLIAVIDEDGSASAGFIDFGMTGRLERRTRDDLAMLVKAIAESDVDEAIASACKLADVPPAKMQDAAFRTDLADMVHTFEGGSFERFDLPGLLDDLFETMRVHRVHFPSDLVLLLKALTTIESVGASLDPSFDLIAHLRPSIERVVERRYGFQALKQRFVEGIGQYASLVEELPRSIKMLLSTVQRNNFAVNLQHRGFSQLTRTLEHASRNIGFALMITGLVVSSALLIHASTRETAQGRFGLLGTIGFITAGAMVVFYFIANRKWLSQKRGDRREGD